MKVFILLNPISNSQGVFAQPRTFDRAQILAEFVKQANVRVFTSEEQAFIYAKTLEMKVSRPPKASGEVALILSAELAAKPAGEEKSETKVVWNPYNEPKDPYPSQNNFKFYEVAANSIAVNALREAKFSDRRNVTIDLREQVGLFASIKNAFSK